MENDDQKSWTWCKKYKNQVIDNFRQYLHPQQWMDYWYSPPLHSHMALQATGRHCNKQRSGHSTWGGDSTWGSDSSGAGNFTLQNMEVWDVGTRSVQNVSYSEQHPHPASIDTPSDTLPWDQEGDHLLWDSNGRGQCGGKGTLALMVHLMCKQTTSPFRLAAETLAKSNLNPNAKEFTPRRRLLDQMMGQRECTVISHFLGLQGLDPQLATQVLEAHCSSPTGATIPERSANIFSYSTVIQADSLSLGVSKADLCERLSGDSEDGTPVVKSELEDVSLNKSGLDLVDPSTLCKSELGSIDSQYSLSNTKLDSIEDPSTMNTTDLDKLEGQSTPNTSESGSREYQTALKSELGSTEDQYPLSLSDLDTKEDRSSFKKSKLNPKELVCPIEDTGLEPMISMADTSVDDEDNKSDSSYSRSVSESSNDYFIQFCGPSSSGQPHSSVETDEEEEDSDEDEANVCCDDSFIEFLGPSSSPHGSSAHLSPHSSVETDKEKEDSDEDEEEEEANVGADNSFSEFLGPSSSPHGSSAHLSPHRYVETDEEEEDSDEDEENQGCNYSFIQFSGPSSSHKGSSAHLSPHSSVQTDGEENDADEDEEDEEEENEGCDDSFIQFSRPISSHKGSSAHLSPHSSVETDEEEKDSDEDDDEEEENEGCNDSFIQFSGPSTSHKVSSTLLSPHSSVKTEKEEEDSDEDDEEEEENEGCNDSSIELLVPTSSTKVAAALSLVLSPHSAEQAENEDEVDWDDEDEEDEGCDEVYGANSLEEFFPLLCLSSLTNSLPTNQGFRSSHVTSSLPTNQGIRTSHVTSSLPANQGIQLLEINKCWNSQPVTERKTGIVVHFSAEPVIWELKDEESTEDRSSDFQRRLADRERMERLLGPVFRPQHRDQVFRRNQANTA